MEQEMRFEVRHNNQVLHVFDTEAWSVVSAYWSNRWADAFDECDRLNQASENVNA